MSVPKYKALLIACITLFLCGCGQALSEREIVRAVFFARQQGQYSVCLLLADQNNNEDGLHYKTSSARGFTAAQALHRAETTLPGRLYYGLIDLAVLPADADWQTARELGSLLYDKAQPAPELSVFALDTAPHSWAEDAAALYEDMKSVRSEYRLHCGLQQLFTQADCCTVPGYRADSGYDLRLYTTYAGGTALCRARIDVTVQDTTVQLHLRDTAFEALTQTGQNLQALFCTELMQTFAALTAERSADFFHLQFWHANLYGPRSPAPAPQLTILWE